MTIQIVRLIIIGFHSGFLVEIGGLEWIGVVHSGIIMDTLPRVPDHS
jgi:hypothetical protein